ncbi:MAG: outer membrane beta-barrel protein, partial [Chitinophagaceae bacterium]
MKKIFIATIFTLCVSLATNAQSYEQGNKLINLSIGLAPTFGTSFSGFGYSTKWTPPVSASFEYGISERISAGVVGGFASQKYTDQDNDGVQYDYLLLGVRGSYHFANTDKFDPYVGLTLGYNKVKAKDIGSSGGGMGFDIAASQFLYGAHLGARYYFA